MIFFFGRNVCKITLNFKRVIYIRLLKKVKKEMNSLLSLFLIDGLFYILPAIFCCCKSSLRLSFMLRNHVYANVRLKRPMILNVYGFFKVDICIYANLV